MALLESRSDRGEDEELLGSFQFFPPYLCHLFPPSFLLLSLFNLPVFLFHAARLQFLTYPRVPPVL